MNLTQNVLVMMRTYRLAVRVLHDIHVYICGQQGDNQNIRLQFCSSIYTHTYYHIHTHNHTSTHTHINMKSYLLISFCSRLPFVGLPVQGREQTGILGIKRSRCVPSTVTSPSRSRCVLCVLLPLENLLWAKLRDYAISRVNPNPRQAFLM